MNEEDYIRIVIKNSRGGFLSSIPLEDLDLTKQQSIYLRAAINVAFAELQNQGMMRTGIIAAFD